MPRSWLGAFSGQRKRRAGERERERERKRLRFFSFVRPLPGEEFFRFFFEPPSHLSA